jgi:hypothetical protein
VGAVTNGRDEGLSDIARDLLRRKPRLQILIIACAAYGILFALMAIVAVGIALQLSAQ